MILVLYTVDVQLTSYYAPKSEVKSGSINWKSLMSYFPHFSVSSFPLLNRGVVLAFAHVRGGGEKGNEWYLAGKKSTKPNTWKDFNACAEWMIENKYTSPEKFAISGGSAGGILIGRAITERPDLYKAAIPQVGALNCLREEFTPSGPANIPEFGTITIEEEFKSGRTDLIIK